MIQTENGATIAASNAKRRGLERLHSANSEQGAAWVVEEGGNG